MKLLMMSLFMIFVKISCSVFYVKFDPEENTAILQSIKNRYGDVHSCFASDEFNCEVAFKPDEETEELQKEYFTSADQDPDSVERKTLIGKLKAKRIPQWDIQWRNKKNIALPKKLLKRSKSSEILPSIEEEDLLNFKNYLRNSNDQVLKRSNSLKNPEELILEKSFEIKQTGSDPSGWTNNKKNNELAVLSTEESYKRNGFLLGSKFIMIQSSLFSWNDFQKPVTKNSEVRDGELGFPKYPFTFLANVRHYLYLLKPAKIYLEFHTYSSQHHWPVEERHIGSRYFSVGSLLNALNHLKTFTNKPDIVLFGCSTATIAVIHKTNHNLYLLPDTEFVRDKLGLKKNEMYSIARYFATKAKVNVYGMLGESKINKDSIEIRFIADSSNTNFFKINVLETQKHEEFMMSYKYYTKSSKPK